jgi:hypothetical protein
MLHKTYSIETILLRAVSKYRKIKQFRLTLITFWGIVQNIILPSGVFTQNILYTAS